VTILVLVTAQERLAFPGWTFPKAWVGFPAGSAIEEFTVASADGNSIQAWWLPPPAGISTSDADALIYFHGNGGNLSTCGKAMVQWNRELRTGVLGFDYPGFGHSTGKPNEQSCFAAGQAAFDWLIREKKIAASHIILVGQSIGGAVATELASRRPCRLLLTSGAFTSFPDAAQHRYFWTPARYLVRLQFNNLEKIGKLQTPVFITHGTNDRVVPFSQGVRLAEAATGAKRFYPVAGQGHSQPKASDFYEAVRQFLIETRTTNLTGEAPTMEPGR